ncbi:MAG: hypothetical protein IJG35_10390 [Bacteroidales bacterium]|nr:hypothetical protein [Bacteroidales bacterium]
MTTERDIRNQLAYAEEKGVEKGMEIGMEKGIEKGVEMGIGKGTETTLQKVGELLRERGMSETEIASLLKAAR